MLRRSALFPLFVLAACSGETGDDSVTPVDTSDTAETDVAPIQFAFTFLDGVSSEPLVGAEVCVEEPVIAGESCFTTDDAGLLEWTWENPEKVDFVARLTLDEYTTTIYAGRYADDVAESWQSQIDETGVVALTYWAFTQEPVVAFQQTGGVTLESGMGMALIFLRTTSAQGAAGAVVTLTDDAGDEVGTMRYVNPTFTALNTALEATTISGAVAFANVEPGTHTLTVTSSDYTCEPGFSWNSDEDNVIQLPVEADVMTTASMNCTLDAD